MCGIAGIFDTSLALADTATLSRMIATIRHRGPDAQRIHVEPGVALGHARLSIIDIAGGAQPMSTRDGRLWITFNGEIFNYVELREELQLRGYRFETRSDTEVILQSYAADGPDCVRRFNGQWAFAIWDRVERRLFLSRDRVGVRPLYYTEAEGRFLFASEMKALFSYPGVRRELDLEGLDELFTFWVTLPPRTVFKGISQLPPGHSMILDHRGSRLSGYWAPSYEPQYIGEANVREAAEELLYLLRDAVRLRLRSDVPVGSYLSGGIDSTFITALVHSHSRERLQTFSVAFEDAEFDERSYQRMASRVLGTEHNEIQCSHADIGEIFPDVIRHTEQPVVRTAPAPLFLLSRLVRKKGFKVVLTGEGADEMLGGYDIFKEAKIRRFCASTPDSRWRWLLLRRLYPYMPSLQSQSDSYLRRFFRATSEDLQNPLFSHMPRWELTSRIKQFYSAETRAALANGDAYMRIRKSLPPGYSQWPAFCQAEYLETAHLLPGYILSSQGDRVSMAHSVEARYPFLDYRVVEFASKLPPTLKMKVLAQKYLLTQAAQGLVPEEIIRRPKQPYRAPDGKCFFGRAGVQNYLSDALSPESVARAGIFDPAAIGLLTTKFRLGRPTGTRDNMALVAVLSTQLLISQFVENFESTTESQAQWTEPSKRYVTTS